MPGRCKSCGTELISETEHAGEDPECPYCSYCADHTCDLKSRGAVENALMERVKEEHPDASDEQAREHVRRQLDEMPAWQ